MIVRLVDALHAGGRCACAGEGWCAWCRTHCLLCGVVVPWSPDPGPTCGVCDRVPRPPGCVCTWEAGDSPCPVHGETEAGLEGAAQ